MKSLALTTAMEPTAVATIPSYCPSTTRSARDRVTVPAVSFPVTVTTTFSAPSSVLPANVTSPTVTVPKISIPSSTFAATAAASSTGVIQYQDPSVSMIWK